MDFLIILILLAAIPGFGVIYYNRLIKAKNLALEGWSGIDVQLKRRADLIPSLVDTVKTYVGHEKGVLEAVAETRSRTLRISDPVERARMEKELSGALFNVMAVAENYPDLKASHNFLELQKSLSDIEEHIQMSRRYYNGTVRELNIQLESFPSNIVASLFHFVPMKYFELEKIADRETPKAAF